MPETAPGPTVAPGEDQARLPARVGSWRSVASWAATLALLLVWSATLRPVALGGPASFIGVDGASMESTLFDGDLVVLRERDSYELGDVVAYRVPEGAPGEGHNIVHRIVGGDGSTGYITQGDNNSYTDVWQPREADVIGEVWIEVPNAARWAGYLRDPGTLALVVGVVSFLLMAVPASGRGARRPADHTVDLRSSP